MSGVGALGRCVVAAERDTNGAINDVVACLTLLAGAKAMALLVVADEGADPDVRVAAGEWVLYMAEVVSELRSVKR